MRHVLWPRSRLFASLMLLSALVLSAPASEGRVRGPKPQSQAPTAPKNLQVTGFTHYSVDLTWSASTDSDPFTYWIFCSNHYYESVPQTSTSGTFTTALYPGVTYTFTVFAVDAAGNRSNDSNAVTVSLPRDTIPPAAPEVTVTDVGPTHVTLAWSAVDDSPNLRYSVFRDGVRILQDDRATSKLFKYLSPSTSYTFTVTARDDGGNVSPPSEPVTVTTEAINTSDVTPPTTPADLVAYSNGDLEIFVYWTQSTDDLDPQEVIRYELYVNGELAEIVIGTGFTNAYGVPGHNVLELFAIDTAGNVSGPVVFEMDLF